MTAQDWQFSLESALAALPDEQGRRFTYPIRNGSMRIGVYAPKFEDDQAPHEQDELYIVASGSGWFVKNVRSRRRMRFSSRRTPSTASRISARIS